jgi:hypothetical protein
VPPHAVELLDVDLKRVNVGEAITGLMAGGT